MGDPGADASRLRAEVDRLQAALDAERRNAAQWQQLAEERRVTLERLRQRRIVRLVLWVARWLLPSARRASAANRRAVRTVGRVARAVVRGPDKLLAPRRAARLARAVRSLPSAPHDQRSVSVVVLTRDGEEHLRRLLPAVRATRHRPLEVVVHDNGSGEVTRSFLAAQDGIVVSRSETNLSYADANNAAARLATGEILCFLNDDVEPLAPDWLDRLLGTLDGDVAAVGAQLVYPRRGFLAARTRDLTVQHLGIELAPRAGAPPQPRNRGHGDAPDPTLPPFEVAAVTGACLLVERDAFEAAGGFDGRYHYGAEDVDLCWRLRQRGGRVVVAPDAVLYHHEGATRHREDPDVLASRQARNWELLESRFGPDLRRAVARDRLLGTSALTSEPYRVGITVTRDLEEAGYGDWYTAHELGDALARLGWTVRYLERYRDAWYDATADLDAVVALHDLFDVRRVARPGLTTIAWVRNWTDRWIGQPWFEDFGVVLVSSGPSEELIAASTRHRPHRFPLATNPDRFAAGDDQRAGVVLTANYWGRDDRIADLVRALPDVTVYGKGWEAVPDVAARWAGRVPYDELAAVYGRALVVVDQTAGPTRPYGALNARVFDALSAGALVVTDQEAGARELFGGELPTYASADELAEVVGKLLEDPEATARQARELRARVLEAHTYVARAAALQQLLVERAERAHVVLRTSCPDRRVAPSWGDWHFAEAFARELRALGHPVAVETMDEWHLPASRGADVAVHLKGRSVAPRYEGQVHAIWNISHPEELTDVECEAADVVFVAAPRFATELGGRVSTPVHVLLQATDERRFRPRPVEPRYAHDVAFVGNSRFVLRPVVRDALAAGLDVAIYGANWEKFVDPRLIRASHVPNEELAGLYSSVKVLLNDHWEGMRRWGHVSNRVYDALACGTVVVSDEMDELRAQFGDAVATYRDADDLRDVVARLLADASLREQMGQQGRARVLAAHTFTHRAREFLTSVTALLPHTNGINLRRD